MLVQTYKNDGLGELVKSLWLELNQSMVQSFAAQNESSAAFFSGKTAGLRLALPLLRGSDYSCQLVASKISFIVNADNKNLNNRADVLKKILKQDLETFQEGGKTGIKKEWLNGHINAIGMSLALLGNCFYQK